MTWQTFIFFLFSTCLICATPGSNMLLAFQFGLNYGLKKTLWTMAGLAIGLAILLGISLFGLNLISTRLPIILTLIKLSGALYLLYLGVQSYRTASQHINDASQIKITPSPVQLFKTGLWVALSNPKAILFFAAFFPKFINFNRPVFVQYVILAVAFFVIELLWQCIYAMSGKQLATWLNQGARLIWLNRICGLIFVLIAVLLIWEVVAS